MQYDWRPRDDRRRARPKHHFVVFLLDAFLFRLRGWAFLDEGGVASNFLRIASSEGVARSICRAVFFAFRAMNARPRCFSAHHSTFYQFRPVTPRVDILAVCVCQVHTPRAIKKQIMNDGEVIPIDSIKTAPKEVPPTGVPIASDALTHDGILDQHLGAVGKFIGGGPEKSGNIAYVVIVASLVSMLVGAAGMAFTQSDKVAEVFQYLFSGCLSLVSGALGYIFGKGSAQSE